MRTFPRHVFSVSVLVVLCWPVGLGAQQDVKGSADHPLFPTRMPGHFISSYTQTEFDAYKFQTPKGPVTIEGKITRINYRRPRGVVNPGSLAIRRNYENAITEAGGEVVQQGGSWSTLRASTKDGGEIWAEITASTNASAVIYKLAIAERAPLKQVITADALLEALNKEGFVSVSIEFDTGKADVKPESLPTVEQIATLLRNNASLALTVEGHTDDVGAADANRKLSQSRAESVVAALVAQGIDRTRLDPMGFGEDKPIADNKTEEGRAKNRRVMLVKK